MVSKVIKRDGKVEDFCSQKIANAISKAMIEVNDEVDYSIINKITNKIRKHDSESLNVEEIQNMIEFELMKSAKEVARAYISYRDKRTVVRQAKTKNVFLDIIGVKSTDVTRENANMNTDTPAGMMMKFASESTKPLVIDYLLSKEVKEAFLGNYIHIHDLDYYPTKSLTCVQYPLDKILEDGFISGHGEYNKAENIEDAVNLCIAAFETCQNEMHGGQAVPAIDFYFAPYVEKTYKEEARKIISSVESLEGSVDVNQNSIINHSIIEYVKDNILSSFTKREKMIQLAINNTVDRVNKAMSKLIHDLNNIHSRGGNQVVFSSINYGTDTSAEGRCVIREILRVTYEGIGRKCTAIFPIQIWKKKRGVNYLPKDKNYDLYKMACKVTARRFFPNFINLDSTFNRSSEWDENDPKRYFHEVATMGCRTRVFENRYGDHTSVGRGNLSFTSINIVKLAIESSRESDSTEEAIDKFYTKLNNTLEIVAKQLDERYQFQKTAIARQFPFLMKYFWNGGENLNSENVIESVLNQGTLGIGFIGLAECLVALTGHHHGESDESQDLGLEIVTYMRDKCIKFSERYNHNYSVLATPAEGLSGKFVRKDKKEFGVIKGVTDKDYYTNSNHIPVYYECTKQHKAEIEAPYHRLTLGGHIFYVEIDGDATHNPTSIMQTVDLMDMYNIGYCSINHNRNRCPQCGFENADKNMKVCPVCGNTHIKRLQRITGYLVGETDRWNSAKRAELKDRVIHGNN